MSKYRPPWPTIVNSCEAEFDVGGALIYFAEFS
jgi:hypothetical protein